VDSPVENDGGAVFGKPQERNSGVIDVGTLGPESVGKEARKVKRVESIELQTSVEPWEAVVEGPRGVARATNHERPGTAAASQHAAANLRSFPREHVRRNQDERSRTVRTWQQCR